MKLIARKDFRNVDGLRLKEEGKSSITDAIHDDHIHKGATFEIGGNYKTIEEMVKKDAPSATIIANLFVAGCVADANDTKAVEAIKAEVAIDEKRAKRAAALDASASNANLVTALTEKLTGKGAAPAK